MYQAFPASAPEASPGPAPASIRRAVYLMYAGAAVYVISGIVGVITLGDVSPGSPFDASPDGRPSVPGAVVMTAMVVTTAIALISIVVPVLLWLWMAWKCKAGRPWARIVSTILFGLGTLVTLASLATTASLWGLLGMIAGWLAGLGATILLWQRSSSRYFGTA